MAGESKIETRSWKNAVRKGWRTVKLMRMSENAWPDRLYVRGPPLRVVLIEYKDDGEPPTAQQALRHTQLRALGLEVYVCDSVEKSDAILCR